MKKITKKNIDIGSYITSEYANDLLNQYSEEYPNVASSFNIKKTSILKVLNASPEVTGIRFFYGLSDLLNPNSVKLILVPCTQNSDFANPKNLIIEQGYMDHNDQVHSILEVSQMIANWVTSLNQRNPELKYKETTRGGFFGRNSLLDLIRDQDCHSISFKLGLKESVISPIMQALNDNGKFLNSFIMDVTAPCPPSCAQPWPETSDEPCALELVGMSTSNKEKIDNYRWFRDHKLLDLEGGAKQYELYYFLSPFVTMVISKNKSNKEILRRMYTERIAPCNAFIANGEYQKALDLLEDTLQVWIAEYKTDLEKAYFV